MFFQFLTGIEAKMLTGNNLTSVFLVLSLNPKVDSFEMCLDLRRKRKRKVTFVTFDFCFWMLASVMTVQVRRFGSFVVALVTF